MDKRRKNAKTFQTIQLKLLIKNNPKIVINNSNLRK